MIDFVYFNHIVSAKEQERGLAASQEKFLILLQRRRAMIRRLLSKRCFFFVPETDLCSVSHDVAVPLFYVFETESIDPLMAKAKDPSETWPNDNTYLVR